MKAIYDAVRLLMQDHSRAINVLPEVFYPELYDFERRNRGHQNILDALAAQTPVGVAKLGPNERQRHTTIVETTQTVLELLDCFTDQQMPQYETFQQMLDAEDTVDFLPQVVENLFRGEWLKSGAELQGVYLRECGVLPEEDGRWSLSLTFGHRGNSLQTTKQLSIGSEPVTTLRNAHSLLAWARHAVKRVISGSGNWQELRQADHDAQLVARTRHQLEQLFQGLNASDRLALGTAWSELKPRCLSQIAWSSGAAAQPANEGEER